MTETADKEFEHNKKVVLSYFNFPFVIVAIRATGFGWGRGFTDKPDDWFLRHALKFATEVMNSAYHLAKEIDDEAWSSCGGFCATARPNGKVKLRFVLESSECDLWDEDDRPPPPKLITHAAGPLINGPRRMLKLHEEQ